jgi:hypothetical protein
VDDSKPPTSLDRTTLHALSNQLAVIFGLVELVLGETAADDPRHADLVEIRDAAINAAKLIGRPLTDPDDPA